MKFNVNKQLFPFESRFLELDNNIKLHYVDEGQGPDLLMFHGNPTWSFLYRDMIMHLKENFRCITFDYPGFGLSQPGDNFDFLPRTLSIISEQLIDRLGLDSVIIICQDWGGPIGLSWAGRNSTKVKGIVIGNTWAWPMNQDLRTSIFSWVLGGPFGRWIAVRFNGVWKFFMMRGFMKKPTADILAIYRAPFNDKRNRIQTAIFPRQLTKSIAFASEVERGLENLRETPVLFCWGTKDFAFRAKERVKFQRIFLNSDTILLKAGHFWQEDAGQVASMAITNWHKINFEQN